MNMEDGKWEMENATPCYFHQGISVFGPSRLLVGNLGAREHVRCMHVVPNAELEVRWARYRGCGFDKAGCE